MRTSLPHLKRRCRRLDGLWDFTFLGTAQDPETLTTAALHYDDLMPVPSAWDAFPAYAGKRGTVAYRTQFEVTPGRKAFLRFRGTGMWNRVFIDGQEVRTFSLPYSQVEIDVPPSTTASRELVVVNDNRFGERVPLQYNRYDFYAYGGLFRSVELHEVPEVFLRRAELLSPDATTGLVRGRLFFDGLEDGDLPLRIYADGEILCDSDVRVADGIVEVEFTVPDAKPWSAESPNLHTIRFETEDDDLVVRVGFRCVEVSAGQILLNGTPVKLLGYCRHEAHPQFGPAVPYQQHVQDLQLMRDMGCNFVRGSHYAQDPEFLELCDEMGFYVFEESLGWGNHSPEVIGNPAFQEGQLEQTRLMIEKSFNHASVILWGYLNEGGSNQSFALDLYKSLYEMCRAMDPSRPVTYASMFPFDDICYDYCDIVSVNQYPGWYAADDEETRPLDEINQRVDKILEHLTASGHDDKPFLITEIGAGAIYGWRDPLAAHWSEEYQADYLRIVCDRVVGDERINGISLWQFCDCRTYSSSRALRRPRAFNNKGTFDEYRRPKMARDTVKKAFLALKDS